MKSIYFDSEGQILYVYGFEDGNLREAFLSSLARGDRAGFRSFCQDPFDGSESEAAYRLYQLSGFEGGKFVFLEKGYLGGSQQHPVNVAYFSDEVSDFSILFSPTSAHYRSVTGRCIYELLLTSAQKAGAAPYQVTPAAFLHLKEIPHLRNELMKDPRLPENCDLIEVSDLVARTVSALPTFAKTKIAVSHALSSEETIVPISLSGYVFLLTALLHLLHGISADHVIDITARRQSTSLSLGLTVRVHRNRLKPIESRSLLALGELVPSMKHLAELASFVAFDAGIQTGISADMEGCILSTTVLVAADQLQPVFHYRCPYTEIPDITAEFIRFMDALSLSA